MEIAKECVQGCLSKAHQVSEKCHRSTITRADCILLADMTVLVVMYNIIKQNYLYRGQVKIDFGQVDFLDPLVKKKTLMLKPDKEKQLYSIFYYFVIMLFTCHVWRVSFKLILCLKP